MINNIIECNGFQAFHGNLIVYDPETGQEALRFNDVDCIYNPDKECWFVSGINNYQFGKHLVDIIPYDLTVGSRCKTASSISILGTELDQCEYEVIEEHYNCKVEVLQCRNCGHTEVSWFRNNGGIENDGYC